jgi:hypothetical protein
LETLYFKEEIVSGNFWHCHHRYEYFLQQEGEHTCTMVGTTPYKLFLKVLWANKQLASSKFTYRTRKKAAGAKSGE